MTSRTQGADTARRSWFLKTLGGSSFVHHALSQDFPAEADEAPINELYHQEAVDVDVTERGTILIGPTSEGRRVVEQRRRVNKLEPTGCRAAPPAGS
jgi:hypothetical protein